MHAEAIYACLSKINFLDLFLAGCEIFGPINLSKIKIGPNITKAINNVYFGLKHLNFIIKRIFLAQILKI
jgi:hypothetical protein